MVPTVPLASDTPTHQPPHSEQVTEQAESVNRGQDGRSIDLYGRADSVLTECERAGQLPVLDTAIHLLRQSLAQRPVPHSRRPDSLDRLATALVTRFSHTVQIQDVDEALLLRLEALMLGHNSSEPERNADNRDLTPERHIVLENEDQEPYNMTALALAALTEFQQSAPISRLNTAVSLHREALLYAPPHSRQTCLSGLASALDARFRHTGQLQDLDEVILLRREALLLQPDQPTSLGALCAALATRFHQTSQLADLHEAVSLRRGALSAMDQAIRLYNSASDILEAFNQSGQVTDLDKAVSLFREALALLPAHYPHRHSVLGNLSIALCERFSQTGHPADLEDAITACRDVLELLPTSHPLRSGSLNNLASALSTRFSQRGQLVDLDEAIRLYQEALVLRPAAHPDRPSSLNTLASALDTRFSQTGQIADLNVAIGLHREALVLLPVPHPARSGLLNDLACALSTQFGQTSQIANLDEAVGLHREALELRPAPHPHRSASLNNLAAALFTRSTQTGRIIDLDESIRLHREALELLPVVHPYRSGSLNNLANALDTRYCQTGNINDLDEAVGLHREARMLRPSPHPLRPVSLNNLASALSLRFGHTGQMVDLDDAIGLQREVLELRPAPHPQRPGSLDNLANALERRFGQTGQIIDLDEAVGLHREALRLLPESHVDRSGALNNLAIALDTRFGQSRQISDLDEAARLQREALRLLPVTHMQRSGSLNNLGAVLYTRFSHTGQMADLDEGIKFHREALELRPAPHPDRPRSLHNLASVLATQFRQTYQLAALEEAIMASREALGILGLDHPQQCLFSGQLGATLMDMYLYTRRPQHLDDAMAAFRTAVTCESASVSARLKAAQLWAQSADGNHDSALEAYRSAIELLPRLAMLGLDLQSRQRVLASGSDGLARNAAACAIRSGQFDEAVRLLEQGRTIFWSQALQLRTPLDHLRLISQDLAQKLEGISRALEQGSLRDVSRTLSDIPQKVMSMEQEAVRYHRLNEDWVATVEAVRKLDEFHDFLRPKPMVTLQRSASKGPVIILNASESGCSALVVTPSGVKHIPFPELSFMHTKALVQLTRTASSPTLAFSPLPQSFHVHVKGLLQQIRGLMPDESRHGRQARPPDIPRDPEDIFRLVLKGLWTLIVKPVICSLDLKKSESPTRLWWCPTGPFAFLPIHAAGIYGIQDSEDISDYVVSSYTPTLDSLLVSMPQPSDFWKVLVAIQPETSGQPPLPGTRAELNKIQGHVPSKYLVRLGIPDAPASVESVYSHLSAASIVHLACHGQQDARNPLNSAFLLGDGPLKVSRIMRQSMPNASLAFLSACQTAMGDENLPDEAIHLAATLLFTGFRGAVATMWSITDSDGPKIADSFYSHLFQSNAPAVTSAAHLFPDTTQAARALHAAVAKLRAEKCSFQRWVPFIHLGL